MIYGPYGWPTITPSVMLYAYRTPEPRHDGRKARDRRRMIRWFVVLGSGMRWTEAEWLEWRVE